MRRDRGLVGGGFGWWFVALEVVRARRRVGGLVVELEVRGRDPCLGSWYRWMWSSEWKMGLGCQWPPFWKVSLR